MDDSLAASSRPKINRLPNYGDSDEAAYGRFPVMRTVGVAAGAIMILTLVPLFWSLKSDSPISEASQAAQASMPDMYDANHIAVHDDNGEMVGQLAKMPADMERGPQVESISQADKNSGKELMKIIGKY